MACGSHNRVLRLVRLGWIEIAAVPEHRIGGLIEHPEIRQIEQHALLLETLSSLRTTVVFADNGTKGARGEFEIG